MMYGGKQMKLKHGMKYLSILMVAMVMSAVIAPVMACNPGTPCGNENGAQDLEDIVSVELFGKDKDEKTAMALQNEEFEKKLKELESEGYSKEDYRAYNVLISSDDINTASVDVVIAHLISPSGDVQYLSFAKNSETGEIVVMAGPLSCVACLGLIVGGGIGCSGVCVVSGALTLGVTCVACILAVGGAGVCPCYDCCCAAGFEECCEASENLC
jgi:hypothetical protein